MEEIPGSYVSSVISSQPQSSQALPLSRANFFSQSLPQRLLVAPSNNARSGLGTAASFLAQPGKHFASSCEPLDELLDGGLAYGQMLEISGPPGAPREYLSALFARGAISMKKGVLYIVSQNMTSPSSLRDILADDASLLHYDHIFTMTGLLALLRTLPSYLDEHPSISLIVLESFWFPFQETSSLSRTARANLLAKVKLDLTRLCAERKVAIITTSQLATKLVHADGTPANFETGAKAILVPQLGTTYLQPSKTYRVIIVPETRSSGQLRLLSSPSSNHHGQIVREVPYTMSQGVMTRGS
ncbi:hypothetical protein PENSPDRAFT_750708 [Peniophora sp. CONT]|nr:hypothetical protein PENSPDRAFT_750708 [Peniophora sp. CONT]